MFRRLSKLWHTLKGLTQRRRREREGVFLRKARPKRLLAIMLGTSVQPLS